MYSTNWHIFTMRPTYPAKCETSELRQTTLIPPLRIKLEQS